MGWGTTVKERVRTYWDERPVGTADVAEDPATLDFFAALDARRYSLEPFIDRYARFEERAGMRLLEIGCGTGGDLVRFARSGSRAVGIDLSWRSIELARRRIRLVRVDAKVMVADAESLPFPNASFETVYSWGVLHHTPDVPRALSEIGRVLAPGGDACVMLYQRHSLFALQAWMRYALFRGRPLRTLTDVIASHVESPGTKAYTVDEAAMMFRRARLEIVRIDRIVTPWDLRVGRRRFLPRGVARSVPSAFGWFMVVEARSPGQGVHPETPRASRLGRHENDRLGRS